MDTVIDFSVLKESGLRKKGELELVLGTTRVMVHRYMDGESFPRGVNRRRAALACKAISNLINKGSLPLPDTKTKEERQAAVDKIAAWVSSKL